jgi:hypothetical protein
MKNRALYFALAAAGAITGYDSLAGVAPDAGSTPASATPPASEPRLQLAQADPKAVRRAQKRKDHSNLKHCQDPSCTVTVTVAKEPCDKNQIKADPDVLAIDSTQKNVAILWTITTPGYTFQNPGGIFWKNAKQGQFKCKAGKNTSEYECVNKNTDAADYAYGIKLVDGNGKVCATDPIIINGF